MVLPRVGRSSFDTFLVDQRSTAMRCSIAALAALLTLLSIAGCGSSSRHPPAASAPVTSTLLSSADPPQSATSAATTSAKRPHTSRSRRAHREAGNRNRPRSLPAKPSSRATEVKRREQASCSQTPNEPSTKSPSPAKTVTSTASSSKGSGKQIPPVSHAPHQSAAQKEALVAQSQQEARSYRKCITAASS
jgi:hypothetical protein